MNDLTTLISTVIAVGGVLYGLLKVIMKPSTDKIEILLKQSDITQKKLDTFIQQYSDVKGDLRLNKKEHEELSNRIQKIEDDLSNLRNWMYEMKGEEPKNEKDKR
ncbi:hypothetical protein PGA94_09420 [Pediococcus pentosaceus]|uniref:hypothetical protein n=1 Tax=Pediococcus pentosaceus TaxID=1255 RepID=UPI00232D0730|nr:hypothetical protein [Pediococcus pentosaceus]MDB1562992.1 hypothetical protein [Pediococcus pentosaceus]